MSDQLLYSAADTPADAGRLRDALMESRQRWRHLASLAADFAFETDAAGCFVLLMPQTVMGWTADALIGEPSERLFGEDVTGGLFNPFRPIGDVRRHHAWLSCADGSRVTMAISATPLRDGAGRITGARGVGIDVTEYDAESISAADSLRRGQVLDTVLSLVKRESGADAMMDAALWGLIHALGAEGAAAIGVVEAGGMIEVLHECGPGASDVLAAAARLIADPAGEPGAVVNPDGRMLLAAGCEIRSGLAAGMAIWRGAAGRAWDTEDTAIARSSIGIVRMILEHESMQREIAQQARTDPVTGLLNRRAFIEEMGRQIARLDRETEPGTLMCVGLDGFDSVNDRFGHAMGDMVLVHVADLLRRLVRPFDLISRLGGDEFAVWLSGADHMTAAERADYLCNKAPKELGGILPEGFPGVGFSVGIATRRAGSQESIAALGKRADLAMYEVKRSGRSHWRVSLLNGD